MKTISLAATASKKRIFNNKSSFSTSSYYKYTTRNFNSISSRINFIDSYSIYTNSINTTTHNLTLNIEKEIQSSLDKFNLKNTPNTTTNTNTHTHTQYKTVKELTDKYYYMNSPSHSHPNSSSNFISKLLQSKFKIFLDTNTTSNLHTQKELIKFITNCLLYNKTQYLESNYFFKDPYSRNYILSTDQLEIEYMESNPVSYTNKLKAKLDIEKKYKQFVDSVNNENEISPTTSTKFEDNKIEYLNYLAESKNTQQKNEIKNSTKENNKTLKYFYENIVDIDYTSYHRDSLQLNKKLETKHLLNYMSILEMKRIAKEKYVSDSSDNTNNTNVVVEDKLTKIKFEHEKFRRLLELENINLEDYPGSPKGPLPEHDIEHYMNWIKANFSEETYDLYNKVYFNNSDISNSNSNTNSDNSNKSDDKGRLNNQDVEQNYLFSEYNANFIVNGIDMAKKKSYIKNNLTGEPLIEEDLVDWASIDNCTGEQYKRGDTYDLSSERFSISNNADWYFNSSSEQEKMWRNEKNFEDSIYKLCNGHNSSAQILGNDTFEGDIIPFIPPKFQNNNLKIKSNFSAWQHLTKNINLAHQTKANEKQIVDLMTKTLQQQNTDIVMANYMTSPSLYPIFYLYPKYIQENPKFRMIVEVLEKYQPFLTFQKKQKRLDTVASLFMVPLGKKAQEDVYLVDQYSYKLPLTKRNIITMATYEFEQKHAKVFKADEYDSEDWYAVERVHDSLLGKMEEEKEEEERKN